MGRARASARYYSYARANKFHHLIELPIREITTRISLVLEECFRVYADVALLC